MANLRKSLQAVERNEIMMKRKWNIIFIIIAMLSLTSCGNVKKQDNAAASAGSIFTGTGIVREADRKPEIQETGNIEPVHQTQEGSQKDEEKTADTATPTPQPAATPTPRPAATSTPTATPQPTPTPTPQPASEQPSSSDTTVSQPVSTPQPTPAATHQHVWEQREVEPNCYRNGARWEVCIECGAVQNEIQLPQLSHVEGEPEVYTEGETTVTTWKCVNCGTVMRKREERPYNPNTDSPINGSGGSSGPTVPDIDISIGSEPTVPDIDISW